MRGSSHWRHIQQKKKNEQPVVQGCLGLLRDLARRSEEFPARAVTWASPDKLSGQLS